MAATYDKTLKPWTMMFEGNKLKASETHTHSVKFESIAKGSHSACTYTNMAGLSLELVVSICMALPCSQAHMHKQYGTAQHSTAQHSAQHSTAQHSTAQHSTAQHSNNTPWWHNNAVR